MVKKIYETKLRCNNCGLKTTVKIPFGKTTEQYTHTQVDGKYPTCPNCGCEKLRGWT